MINSSLPFFVITNVEEFLYEITRVDIRIFPVNNTAKKKKTKQKQKQKKVTDKKNKKMKEKMKEYCVYFFYMLDYMFLKKKIG